MIVVGDVERGVVVFNGFVEVFDCVCWVDVDL